MSRTLDHPALRSLARYDPTQARAADALHDARIELAARLGNVEALEREIDKKIDDQEDAVNWWRANVRRPGSRRSNISDTEIFTEQAEKILGFNAVTISRWAKKLAKRDEYREQISRAARRKLQLESEENHPPADPDAQAQEARLLHAAGHST